MRRQRFDRIRSLLWPALLALVTCVAGSAGFAETSHADKFALQDSLDHVWTMTAAGLVFFMQVGFLFLEAGSVRSKNSVNVAQKNMMDFILSTLCFGLLGFGLMFGDSVGGWIGWSQSMFAFGAPDAWGMTFFVFQLMFCGTAATIVSGAVAERMSMNGYIAIVMMIGAFIYPTVGHWAWGNLLIENEDPWLARMGFIDFAGSTVVHAVGGWVALAAIIVIGPRFGKFDEAGKPRTLHGHSPVMASVGLLIIWIGWIGFNGGSTTAGTAHFAHIVMNTMIAGAAGGFAGTVIGRGLTKRFRPEYGINGVLAGLVGITAGCDVVSAMGSFWIGISSAMVAVAGMLLLEKVLKLDDPIGAVAVHGFAGVWGTIMTAVFAAEDLLLAGSRIDQLWVQVIGSVATFAFAFGSAYVILMAIKLVTTRPDGGNGLRVPEDDERIGLNISEHDAPMGTGILQDAMLKIANEPDGQLRHVDIDHGDEAFETAQIFNRIIDNISNARRDEQEKYDTQKAERMAVEAEIAEVVNGCIDGHFDRRLPLEGKTGFLLEMSKLVNSLCDATSSNLEEVCAALEAVQDGDLTQGVSSDRNGLMGRINGSVNATIQQLATAMEEVQDLVMAAGRGDYSQRLDMAGRTGFFGKLSEGLNNLCDISDRGLSRIGEALEAIAQGDLNVRTDFGTYGRFAEIADTLGVTVQELSGLVTSIRGTADSVREAGGQVARGNEQMSDGCRSQIDLVDRSFEEMRAVGDMAAQFSKDSAQAQRLSDEALLRVAAGQKASEEARQQINSVANAAEEISKTIDLIETIAMQTNLLSLNASVEAVRSGGDGSGSTGGFKVVAQEVRDLATRTAEAAEEVRKKTQDVSKTVERGVKLVNSAHAALGDAADSVTRSAEVVKTVSKGSQEQTGMVERVGKMFADVSTQAKRNGTLAENAATASGKLVSEAEQTVDLLSKFKVPGEHRAAA